LYAKLERCASAIKAGDATTLHTSFETDELPALRAPVTELVWVTPKPGIELSAIAQAVAAGVQTFNEEAACSSGEGRCFGAAWGKIVERHELCYVAGWSSMEVSLHDRIYVDEAHIL
jgi:hypothetical protein